MKNAVTRERRDPLVFISVVLVGIIIIGFLWLISRNADSAGVAGNINDVDVTPFTGSEACQNWANYWVNDSGINAPPTALEAMSVCRETVDQGWIVPVNAADPSIQRPVIISDAERQQTQGFVNAIQQSIAAFVAGQSDDLNKAIAKIYDPQINGPDGHLLDGQPITGTRNLYNQELNAFLKNPGNEDLAAYVAWVVPYRTAAFADFMKGCSTPQFQYLIATCKQTGDQFSVKFIPWTWDLSDSLLLDTYVRAVLDGEAPPPPGFTPS